MTTTTKTACGCGNMGCDVRIARGLVPFCQMPAPAPAPRGGFGSYAAASAARSDGEIIRSCGGGLTGSPSGFVLVDVITKAVR